MMKMKLRFKRMLCLLLSVVMVLQQLPMPAFAAVATEGSCGSGLSWKISGDVLYIEGEGEMYDFLGPYELDENGNDLPNHVPWGDHHLSKIVVGEGVTYIGNNAFYEMYDVVEVELPSTLKGIGYYAFSYMEKLEIVNLPEGLETMGHSAFSVCLSLDNLTIPSTLKVIPESAFWSCKSLTNLTISYGVEEIGEGAFDSCSGLDAESDGGNDLSTKFEGKGLKCVEIPGSVKKIGYGAFAACTMLHEVILHEGIERIEGGAFNMCDRLYDITLPSTIKTMGENVFSHLGGYVDYELESMGIPVTKQQNVYVLSRELSLSATEEYETDGAWFDNTRPFARFHIYEDSVIAGEIEEYNAEVDLRNEEYGYEYLKKIRYSYIPDCEHELGAFVSDNENTHTRTCVDESCTASQTAPHTLTVDFSTIRGGTSCDEDTVYQMYCTACDYVGEVVVKPASGHDVDYYSYSDEEFHIGYCDNCWEEVYENHEWEYEVDVNATGPYEVEAYCIICDGTATITVLPLEATIVSIKTQDENGDKAPLPEELYSVHWEDGEGNILGEGSFYNHIEAWIVSEERPVYAVISFRDEVRQAYSVSEAICHKVTELGEQTEYVLTLRDRLTVKGRLMVDGYTYPPVDSLELTITTELAGKETTVEVTPDSNGYFTAQIRRTPARLVYSSFPYESIVIENVQMLAPDADGAIDVGTLTLENQMQWYYRFALDDAEQTPAQSLVNDGTPVTVINNETGAEYNGAKLGYEPAKSGDPAYLTVELGMDMDEYFDIGDSVTINCARTDEIIFEPLTFDIANITDNNIHEVTVYTMPKLEISLDKDGYIFIFDSDNNIIFDGYQKAYTEYLPFGEYTYVIVEQNYRLRDIEAPDALEKLGVPEENYLRGTVDLLEDKTFEFELPQFYYGGRMAMSVSFDTDMQSDNLVPMYLNFNHVFNEAYENGETIKFTLYSGGSAYGLPFGAIGGNYVFSSDVDVLSERVIEGSGNTPHKLEVTVDEPRGTLSFFIKPLGSTLTIRAESTTGDTDYMTVYVPALDESSVKIVDPSGKTTDDDSFITLYTKLSNDYAPYIGHLYVNGEIECEKQLNIVGEGRNYLAYQLEKYNDGLSNHRLYVEITNKDGELVWTSNEYTVTLVDNWFNSNEPAELIVRTKWLAGDYGMNLFDRINLQNNPGTGHRFYVNTKSVNVDGTLNVETVFDYSLRMTNDTSIINDTVMMKVFCGETYKTPTIHDVKLLYNKETKRYEGTLTLEAGEYTVYDLPYGYSFDYSLGKTSGGSDGTGGLGGGYSFSMEQFTEEVEEQASTYILAQEGEPYEYYDPDDVEFAIGNMEGLTEQEKQMMRTLLSISNDFYNLQNDASLNSIAQAEEMLGGNTVSDTPSQGIQDILDGLGGSIEGNATELSTDQLSDLEYTEVDTSKIGDDLDMVLDSFYMKTDVESLKTTVVDPNYGVEFTVDHNAIVSGGDSGTSFAAAIKVVAKSFFDGALNGVDLVLDATAKVRKYLDNELMKKLGQEMDIENLEEGIAAWKQSLAEIEARVHNIEWGDNYEKSIFEAQRKTLDDILESRQTRDTIASLEQTLKELRSDLANTKLNIENCQRVAGSKFRKYQRVLNALDSKWAKGIFIGLDIYGLVDTVMEAVEAFDKCIENNERIERTERQADRMKNALTTACPSNTDNYLGQWNECSEVHAELSDALGSARKWNENYLYVKYGQVVSELTSIAAGLVLKGPQGIMVSLGLEVIGGGSEWFVLEKFNDALEEAVEKIPKVEEECLSASQDPNIAEEDCSSEPPGGEPGGSGSGGSGSGLPGGSGSSGADEEPKYPVKSRVLIDPAGYVYEAVASNRIEGATAKIYYENNGAEVYWDDAELYGEINPQITDIDGRFAWMTPIGNWRVKVEKEGYESADSSNDPAADANGWLPVPPPQLDVNIPMISTAAPEVLSANAAPDRIRVVFSQYMDVVQFVENELVTVTRNGQPIDVDIAFEDEEISPTNDSVSYGRIMKLTRTDGEAFSGDEIELTVDGSAENYAGNTLGSDYINDSMTVEQIAGSLMHSYPNRFVTDIGQTEQIAVQVLDTEGKPMAGVTVSTRQKVGGTMSVSETAVSDANGTAVFTVKGISAGDDILLFAADSISAEMNTRVSHLGNKAPQKPEANLSDYAVVEEGTELVLTYSGTEEDVIIYYTTNNTCPCTESAERMVYDGPIEITEDTYFRIAAWTKAGGYSERLNLHITVGFNVDEYTVTFDSDGGSEVLPQNVIAGQTVTEPEDPVKDGFIFKGWTLDGVEYDFDTEVNEDMTLVAIWEMQQHVHVFDQKIANEEYLASEATCTQKAKYYKSCICGAAGTKTFTFGELAEHTAGSEWKKDETYHWYVCTASNCEAEIEGSREEHIPDREGGATEEYAVKCEVCGYELEAQVGHTHKYDQKVVDEEYLASEATCTQKAKYYKSCICGAAGMKTFQSGKYAEHTPGTKWKKDADEHWHVCKASGCGAVIADSVEEHTDGDKNNVCDICDYNMSKDSGSGNGSGSGSGSGSGCGSGSSSGSSGKADKDDDAMDGWVKSGNTTRFYRNGKSVVGWKRTNGNWYYFSKESGSRGNMVTGWLFDVNQWYYLDENGVMQTGWKKIGDKWYYLKENGAMKIGWFWDPDYNAWYYLNENGAMHTGWLWDPNYNAWYYLSAPSGEMLRNAMTPDGYLVDSEGQWVK
ncbi:MAG: hypothetical protein E7246_00360 [Lachnoclostridium sp.]|nr:hypothetical protein [Lachnoclostridium sp.]